MQDPYSILWSVVRPGCLMDQSETMSARTGTHGKTKADALVTFMNGALEEIILACTRGNEVRNRVSIAVLGYHSSVVESALPTPLSSSDYVTPYELRANPRRIGVRRMRTIDIEGKEFEEELYFSEWLDAVAHGEAPMCTALKRAEQLAESRLAAYPDSYPPIVVHVTGGGEPTDDNDAALIAAASRIVQLTTSVGRAVLYTCHIARSGGPLLFPDAADELPDETSRLYYNLSSELPETSRETYAAFVDREIPPGTRGYMLNGDASSFRRILPFLWQRHPSPPSL